MAKEKLVCSRPNIAVDEVMCVNIPVTLKSGVKVRLFFWIPPDPWMSYQSDPKIGTKVSQAFMAWTEAAIGKDSLLKKLFDIQLYALGGNPMERKPRAGANQNPAHANPQPAPIQKFPLRELKAKFEEYEHKSN